MNNRFPKTDFEFFIFSVLSAVICAIAMVTFSIPAKLYPGGFGGISRIISDLLLDYYNIDLPFAYLYTGFNLILFIFVFRFLGKRFALYSLLQAILLSVFSLFFKPVISLDDPLLMAVFGGVIYGFGSGLALSHNSSGGGTDFIAVYIATKYKKSAWNYIMLINVVILAIAGIIYGWERALYSMIWQYCSTQVVNKMHRRYQMETLLIVTSKPEEVKNEIFACSKHGLTEIRSQGLYQHTNNYLLYTVVNSFQTNDIITAILKADPKAFINVSDTTRIIGNYTQDPLL